MQNIILNIFNSLLYPPTEDQLGIIHLLNGFLKPEVSFWFLRILSLVVLFLAIYFWYRIVKLLVGKIIGLISCLIVFLSPTFYILWLSYPFDCLKILLLLFIVFLFFINRKVFYKWILIVGVLFIILFLFLITKERSSFVYKLGLKDASLEVQQRFSAEDSLIDPVKVPLKLKRTVYNKYFISYKELINEVIPFFDVESLFFQEVHPLEQKSVIIFVWPEIFLLIGGIYILIKSKNKKNNLFIVIMLIFSLINFLFTPFAVFRKFELILFPLSLIMALSVLNIYKTKIIFRKIVGYIVILFCLYGISANYSDLNKRPEFWLDNRPYFYDFVFKSIKKRNLDNFEKIYISSLIGNTKEYCDFYLENCNENKFIFNSFDLSNNSGKEKSIYAGFVGEFVGSDFKNNINSEWKTIIEHKGLSKIGTKELRDTIAYKYGNIIIVGETN